MQQESNKIFIKTHNKIIKNNNQKHPNRKQNNPIVLKIESIFFKMFSFILSYTLTHSLTHSLSHSLIQSIIVSNQLVTNSYHYYNILISSYHDYYLLCPLCFHQLHEIVIVPNILYYSSQQPNEEVSIPTNVIIIT